MGVRQKYRLDPILLGGSLFEYSCYAHLKSFVQWIGFGCQPGWGQHDLSFEARLAYHSASIPDSDVMHRALHFSLPSFLTGGSGQDLALWAASDAGFILRVAKQGCVKMVWFAVRTCSRVLRSRLTGARFFRQGRWRSAWTRALQACAAYACTDSHLFESKFQVSPGARTGDAPFPVSFGGLASVGFLQLRTP